MLEVLRQQVITHLWSSWCNNPAMKSIRQAFPTTQQFFLDHFAIIDLPSSQSGIPILLEILKTLEYSEKGRGYLPEKQNDFRWMSQDQCEKSPVRDVLPQIVIADFRVSEMPQDVRGIIEKYATQTTPINVIDLQQQINRVREGDTKAYDHCYKKLTTYFAGRDWPLPTTREFFIVQEFNELLAWVLIFGRKPNHFTLSIHLLDQFEDLDDFHRFIGKKTKLSLNQKGGVIKGGKMSGIAQSSTDNMIQTLQLADGEVSLPTGFVEFVWRYSQKKNPELWGDYFTGFIPTHADRVIESLYKESLA